MLKTIKLGTIALLLAVSSLGFAQGSKTTKTSSKTAVCGNATCAKNGCKNCTCGASCKGGACAKAHGKASCCANCTCGKACKDSKCNNCAKAKAKASCCKDGCADCKCGKACKDSKCKDCPGGEKCCGTGASCCKKS